MSDVDLVGTGVTPFQLHPEAAQEMAERPDMPPPVVSGGSGHGRSDGYSSTTVADQGITDMQNADFKELHIVNDEHGEGGFGQNGSDVVQHRDGGPLRQQRVPEEVPPSYDSISPDEHGATGRS